MGAGGQWLGPGFAALVGAVICFLLVLLLAQLTKTLVEDRLRIHGGGARATRPRWRAFVPVVVAIAIPLLLAAALLGYVAWDKRRFEAARLDPRDYPGAAALVAFRGHPFQVRGLAPSSEYPWAWLSIVWGCEFDPVARRAWAAVADLGLLLTLDYDSGAVLDRRFIGMGMRSMALDAARHRLYVANFLRGDVVSYDLGTGAEAGRWFAGRFVRGLRLSRDGRSLWVGSNLGVLSISLEAVPPS